MRRLPPFPMLRPLRYRNFALLWAGLTVSLVGDGIYFVAVAWQAYELSNAPTALAVVGISWTAAQIAFVLVGGAISDRFERRRVLIAADLVRAAAIAVIGVLSVTGELQLWQLCVLVAVYGAGSSLFMPAFSALVPQLVPANLLLEANALERFVRPFAARLAGPILGGAIVAAAGPGTAFLIDAATFGASLTALVLIRVPPALTALARSPQTLRRDVGDGLRFIRTQTWLVTAFVASTVAMLFFLGPVYVLLPFVVKNELDAGAGGLGLVFAAGGVGALVGSVVVGTRRLPSRPLVVVYTAWAGAAFGLVGYALAGSLWQVVVISFGATMLLTIGQILWSTVLQTVVPNAFLGRVASVDWLITLGLTPISYALTGPIANAVGADTTLFVAGILSGSVLLLVVLRIEEPRVAPPPEPEPAAILQ